MYSAFIEKIGGKKHAGTSILSHFKSLVSRRCATVSRISVNIGIL